MYHIFFTYCRWMNTLGMAALNGIDVVLRHSFFDYGYTHLVDQNFNPLPVSLFILFQKRLKCLFTFLVLQSKWPGSDRTTMQEFSLIRLGTLMAPLTLSHGSY